MKQVADDIEELILLNKQNDEFAMVNKMKDIVPEFISKNSKFEGLDNNRSESIQIEAPTLRVLQD